MQTQAQKQKAQQKQNSNNTPKVNYKPIFKRKQLASKHYRQSTNENKQNNQTAAPTVKHNTKQQFNPTNTTNQNPHQTSPTEFTAKQYNHKHT